MGFFKSDMSSFLVPETTMPILSNTDLFVWGIGEQNYSFKDMFTLDCGEVAILFSYFYLIFFLLIQFRMMCQLFDEELV
jgi:hypothetical protein